MNFKQRGILFQLLRKSPLSITLGFLLDDNGKDRFVAQTQEMYISANHIEFCESNRMIISLNHDFKEKKEKYFPVKGIIDLIISLHNLPGNHFRLLRSRYLEMTDCVNLRNNISIKRETEVVKLMIMGDIQDTQIAAERINIQLNPVKLIEFLLEHAFIPEDDSPIFENQESATGFKKIKTNESNKL